MAGGCAVVVLQAAQRFPVSTIVFMVALYAVVYLLFFRPQQNQQRKRREMLGKLKREIGLSPSAGCTRLFWTLTAKC